MELGKTGDLTAKQIKAINTLMKRGHTMRQAKRILGITQKDPIKDIFKHGKQ